MNLENWGGDWLYRLDGISKQGFFLKIFTTNHETLGPAMISDNLTKLRISGWWQLKYLLFSLLLGEMVQFD